MTQNVIVYSRTEVIVCWEHGRAVSSHFSKTPKISVSPDPQLSNSACPRPQTRKNAVQTQFGWRCRESEAQCRSFPALFSPVDRECPEINAGGSLNKDILLVEADVVPQIYITAFLLKLNCHITLRCTNRSNPFRCSLRYDFVICWNSVDRHTLTRIYIEDNERHSLEYPTNTIKHPP